MKFLKTLAAVAVMSALCSAAVAQSVLTEARDATVETAGRVTSSVSSTVSTVADDLNLPPLKMGFTAGMTSSSFSDNDFSTQVGYQFGVTFMFDASELIDDTYIRTGLFFQRKGAHSSGKAEKDGSIDYAVEDVTFKTAYLELPLRYGYAIRANNYVTFLGETGPYVAFGLWGRQRGTQKEFANDHDYSIRFFNETKDGKYNPYTTSGAKRYDWGWGYHLGILLCQNHQFMVGYDFGLLKMNNVYKRNRNLQVSYAYYFM